MVLIDASTIAYQVHFGMKRELSHQDEDTKIIYGFMLKTLELGSVLKTPNFVFCFDSPVSFRKKEYPEYKGGRNSKMDDEERENFHRQFDLVKEYVLPKLGYKNLFEAKGYEADDIMCNLVNQWSPLIKMTMVTTDNDMLQCLNNSTKIYNPQKKKFFTKKDFVAKYGIQPEQWRDVKALAGCKTDNVKGCEGIGEKTAIKYLRDELNKDSKKYQAIQAYYDDPAADCDLVEMLVALPFSTSTPIAVTDNEFSRKGFMEVCDRFGFDSFKNELLPNWKQFFSKKKKTRMGRRML